MLNEKGNNRWLSAAMIAPVIQAASNCSWVSVLVIGFLCGAIIYGMRCLNIEMANTKLLMGIQWLWMLLVVSEFLHWIMMYWPHSGNYYAIPILTLALAVYSLGKGRREACAAAGVLLWAIALLVVMVFLSGLREIRMEHVKPQWKMQTAYYIVVLLIPAMVSAPKDNGIAGKTALLGVVTSVITTGVLSLEYIESVKAPFYEMTRSLCLFGTAKRFESVVAAGMTLSYFALISLLVQTTADAWGGYKSGKAGIYISAAFITLIFQSGMRMNSRLLAIGTLLFWVVLPALEKVLKNNKNTIDKFWRWC